MWPDRRRVELYSSSHVQDRARPRSSSTAPIAGAMDWELAAAVADAGGLGSLPCAMLNPEQVRDEMGKIRARTKNPINLNFFCHTPPVPNNAREARWRDRLAPYYRELGDRSCGAHSVEQPHRVRCGDVRRGGGDEARRGELSLRPAGGALLRRVKAAGCRC